jgi:hypothetical protein
MNRDCSISLIRNTEDEDYDHFNVKITLYKGSEFQETPCFPAPLP